MQTVKQINQQTEFSNWFDARTAAQQQANLYGATVIVKCKAGFRVLVDMNMEDCRDLAGDCETLESFITT